VLDRECIGVVMDSDLTVHLIAAKTALTVTVQCLPPLIMLATSRKKKKKFLAKSVPRIMCHVTTANCQLRYSHILS